MLSIEGGDNYLTFAIVKVLQFEKHKESKELH